MTGRARKTIQLTRNPAVQRALDESVLHTLPGLTLGLTLFYVVIALAHYFVLPGNLAIIMSTLAVVSAIGLFWFHARLRQKRIPINQMYLWIILWISPIVLTNTLLHMVLVDDINQTTNVLIFMIGMGYVILNTAWLVGLLATTAALWFVMVLQLSNPDNLLHFSIAIVSAAAFGVIIHFARRKSLIYYARMQLGNKRRQEELHRRALQLETTVAVGQSINAILDLQTLIEDVAGLVKRSYKLYFVGIYLIGENNHIMAQAGTSKPAVSGKPPAWFMETKEGLIGWVLQEKQAALANDAQVDERFIQSVSSPETQAELVLPIVSGGILLGVMDLQSEKRNFFQDDDVAALQVVADQVATAVANAKLYQGERSARQLAELMQRSGQALTSNLKLNDVLDAILSFISEIISANRISILVKENEYLRIRASRGFGEDYGGNGNRIYIGDAAEDGIFPQIYRTQEPLYISDVDEREDWIHLDNIERAKVWLGLPLIHNEEVIGILSLVRVEDQPFTHGDIERATVFANQAAIALQNALLYDQVTRFNQQMEHEVSVRTLELRKAYEQLERLDQAKADFIRIISHELRTPLTVLRGYSQMLARDPEISANGRFNNLVTGIDMGSLRLQELVDSMFDMARLDNRTLELHITQFAPYEVVDEAVELLQVSLNNRKQTLTIDPAIYKLPQMQADYDLMVKVVQNVLTNSIKYTPDKGQIQIKGVVDYTKGEDAPQIEFVVSDSGIGVQPEAQELIFTKFYQTGKIDLHSTSRTKFKGGGPGLGLAIAKGIVGLHRGEIWLESEGHDEEVLPGSRVYIRVPQYAKYRTADGSKSGTLMASLG